MKVIEEGMCLLAILNLDDLVMTKGQGLKCKIFAV